MFIDHSKRLSDDDWREVFDRIELPKKFWSSSIHKVSEFPGKASFISYWTEAPKHIAKGGGLFLYGPNGTGKSSMAALVAKRAAQYGTMSLWIRMRDLVSACVENRPFSASETYDERTKSVPLLIIDEVIIHDRIRFSEEHLEEVIRHRVDKNLATILTSNVPIQGIIDRFSSLGSILHERVFWKLEVNVVDRRGTPARTKKEDTSTMRQGKEGKWTP